MARDIRFLHRTSAVARAARLALRRRLMSLIREESLEAVGGEINDLGMQGLNIELQGHSLVEVL